MFELMAGTDEAADPQRDLGPLWLYSAGWYLSSGLLGLALSVHSHVLHPQLSSDEDLTPEDSRGRSGPERHGSR
jgi:hypothetical protein